MRTFRRHRASDQRAGDIDYVPALLDHARVRARAENGRSSSSRATRRPPPPTGVRPPVQWVQPDPAARVGRRRGPARAAFRVNLGALAAPASRLPAHGPIAIPATYLEAIVSRA